MGTGEVTKPRLVILEEDTPKSAGRGEFYCDYRGVTFRTTFNFTLDNHVHSSEHPEVGPCLRIGYFNGRCPAEILLVLIEALRNHYTVN